MEEGHGQQGVRARVRAAGKALEGLDRQILVYSIIVSFILTRQMAALFTYVLLHALKNLR